MRYNVMVFPRAFAVTVDADSEEDAMKRIEEYVLKECTVTLVRNDDSYDPENLLDDGVDICDLICKEEGVRMTEQKILCEILGCQYNKDEWCTKEDKRADESVPQFCLLKDMEE